MNTTFIEEFEEIEKFKTSDTVCIIGFAPSWSEAPFNQYETVDIWGINELYGYILQEKIETKFKIWFETHDINKSPSKQNKMHQQFLENCKIPLVTLQHWDKYPTSMPYPRDYVKGFFNKGFIMEDGGAGFSDYSNQISWLISLAICMGYEKILVYGVDMAQDSEYAFQRASCQFFLGYALGSGIQIKIPATSQLLKGGCDYGFESDNKNRFSTKAKIKETTKRQNDLGVRNLELEYLASNIDEQLKAEEQLFSLDMNALKQQMVSLESTIQANLAIDKFLKEMPEDTADILKGKDKLINRIPTENDKLTKNLDQLKKQLNSIRANYDRKQIQLNVQKSAFKKEAEKNSRDMDLLSGIINNCNHMLNRNLV